MNPQNQLPGNELTVRVTQLNASVPLPQYQSAGAAGADVHACIAEPVSLPPGERILVPTGLSMEIPEGYEIQVRSRSGLAIKNGIFVVNSPGTIDSDYRGEIKIILGNIGTETIIIKPFDRIAQLILCPVFRASWEPANELSSSERAHGGFGSTGH